MSGNEQIELIQAFARRVQSLTKNAIRACRSRVPRENPNASPETLISFLLAYSFRLLRKAEQVFCFGNNGNCQLAVAFGLNYFASQHVRSPCDGVGNGVRIEQIKR